MSNRGYWRDRPSWRQQEGRTERSGFPRDQFGHEHSSEQLFDRRPFGPDEDPHYYGTGAAGWGGPGYTGGAYGYGDGSRFQRQDLEGEYSDESGMSYEGRERGASQGRDYRSYQQARDSGACDGGFEGDEAVERVRGAGVASPAPCRARRDENQQREVASTGGTS